MHLVRNAKWQEIFEGWRIREANNPGWVRCATEIKGWSNWEEWRNFTAQQIGAEDREWGIFQFSNPLREIPEILLGPFSSWQDKVVDKNKTSFKQLLQIPQQYQELKQHPGIQAIYDGLPFSTDFIGLIREDINKVVCIEGHHRATAIALAQYENREIDFTKHCLTIALATVSADQVGLFDAMLVRGTSRDSL